MKASNGYTILEKYCHDLFNNDRHMQGQGYETHKL